MKWCGRISFALAIVVTLFGVAGTPTAQAQEKKPNILVIMGDDVGWFNIGAYHRGIMSGKTPNLDKLAAQGMMFTDYYAEASCTAGRANFITGELPLRTGLDDCGSGRRRRWLAGTGSHHLPPPLRNWGTRPDSLARTTSAT